MSDKTPIPFSCPYCGTDKIDRVETNQTVYTTGKLVRLPPAGTGLVLLQRDGSDAWVAEQHNSRQYFRCHGCTAVLYDVEGKRITGLQDLADWVQAGHPLCPNYDDKHQRPGGTCETSEDDDA